MINNPKSSSAGTASISAMELRSNPGTWLDKVNYLNESFIIERAGKAKAALVPISIFNIIDQAQKNIQLSNKKIRKAFKNEDPGEVYIQISREIRKIRDESR